MIKAMGLPDEDYLKLSEDKLKKWLNGKEKIGQETND